jgi:DNA-binding NarL/FixJ family response regulator
VKVLIVDDHKLFRDGLRGLLRGRPGIVVAGEAGDGEAALRFVREHGPDVVLMDISMPGLNGLEAMREILAVRPATKIVILSMHADRRFVIEALKAGASGYFLKNSSVEDIEAGLRGVLRGEVCLCPSVSTSVIREYVSLSSRDDESAFSVLTDRERQVLQLLAEGLAAKEAAARLHVSVKTAESHRARIMAKLDIHSIAELTKYAIREGLTSLD